MTDDRVLFALIGALEEAHGPPRARGGALRLGIAVSGGLDSMVLLEAASALCSLRPDPPHVVVLHLDHGLRPTSRADAAFVTAAARNRGLSCRSERCETLIAAGPSLEARARMRRHDFFRRMAEAESLDLVLLAHHRDDQRETVAHNLMRGSGILETAGMPAGRPLGGASSARLLRPFLGLERRHLLAFARRRGLDWREDESNRDPRHRRNRIRHEILPRIAAGNGLDRLDHEGRGLARRAEALARRLEGEIVRERFGPAPLGPQGLALDGTGLRRLPRPLVRRILERVLRRLDCARPPAPDALRRLLEGSPTPGTSLDLAPGIALRIMDEQGDWRLEDRRRAPSFESRELGIGRSVRVAELRLEIGLARPRPPGSAGRGGSWFQDLPLPTSVLVLRPARSEDRILPFGRGEGGEVGLKRYLGARGVSAPRREHFPVLADAEGVLWPLGLPPSERVRVTGDTSTVRVTLRPR